MSKACVLLVDDHPENLMALEAILGSLGENVNLIRATSGEEALRCILQQDFAVILLDAQMQGMSGVETAIAIKQRKKSEHTPIIFLTAFDKTDLQIGQGYSAGAVDYLIKPVSPEILKAKVTTFVNLYLTHERIRELDVLKAKFMADTSHELRTPIANLELRLYLLEHDATEDKRSEHIRQLRKQINRLHELLDNVLSFTDLQDVRVAKTFLPLELTGVVEQVVVSCYPDARQTGLTLDFHPAVEQLPIYGNEAYLSLAIRHLVMNAIRYTPSGSVEVATRSNPTHGQACLLVQDTGIGIPPEDIPHIFDAFYRGYEVGSSNIPGTGLGLSVTREIVELHGGTIEVESAKGKGSSFRIELPLAS